MTMLKGVWIQEGSLLGWLYALGTSTWRFFGVVDVVGGVQAPFFNAVPSLLFNCVFSLQSLHEQTVTDEMFWATTVIAALLLLHLGILYSPCQVHHKLFCNPINSVGIITSLCPHFFWHLLPPSMPNAQLVLLGQAGCP